MRNWRSAERAIRREIGLFIGPMGGTHPYPMVFAVGDEDTPEAVMALGAVDPDDPLETMFDLATMAVAFHPTRALVALAVPRDPRRRTGLVVLCDTTAVADGLVETTRAWMWWRVGSRLFWPRVEVRRWESDLPLLTKLAACILERRRRLPPEVFDGLLRVTRAAGHRVRLAR